MDRPQPRRGCSFSSPAVRFPKSFRRLGGRVEGKGTQHLRANDATAFRRGDCGCSKPWRDSSRRRWRSISPDRGAAGGFVGEDVDGDSRRGSGADVQDTGDGRCVQEDRGGGQGRRPDQLGQDVGRVVPLRGDRRRSPVACRRCRCDEVGVHCQGWPQHNERHGGRGRLRHIREIRSRRATEREQVLAGKLRRVDEHNPRHGR